MLQPRLLRAPLAGALLAAAVCAAPATAEVPVNAQASFLGAQALMKQSQHRAALDLLDTALKEAPDYVDALRLRSDARERLAGADATLEALASPRAGVDYKQLAALLKGAADDAHRFIGIDAAAKDMDATIDRIGQLRARQTLAEKIAAAPPTAAPAPALALAPAPEGAATPSPAPAPAAVVASGTTPPPNNNQRALDDCLARPVMRALTSQTNPFLAHANKYVQLLRGAEQCPPGNDAAQPGNPWYDCMGTNARSWPDALAQADNDHYFRRASAVGAPFRRTTSLGGVREYCLTMGRSACVNQLMAQVGVMYENYQETDRVWAAERQRQDEAALREQGADCRRRFP